MSDLNIEGMALAEGVVETVVSIAVADVDGVACVGSPSATNGILSMFGGKPSAQGVEVTAEEDGKLQISVRIEAYYGYVLPEVAAAVRTAVADSVASQVGTSVSSVDVYIDGIQFKN
jgi:uncharacterized alkaline shock family protein YloU